MSVQKEREQYWGILNTERNIMLTSSNGPSIWKSKEYAKDVKDGEFGGGNHLELVKVIVEQ